MTATYSEIIAMNDILRMWAIYNKEAHWQSPGANCSNIGWTAISSTERQNPLKKVDGITTLDLGQANSIGSFCYSDATAAHDVIHGHIGTGWDGMTQTSRENDSLAAAICKALETVHGNDLWQAHAGEFYLLMIAPPNFDGQFAFHTLAAGEDIRDNWAKWNVVDDAQEFPIAPVAITVDNGSVDSKVVYAAGANTLPDQSGTEIGGNEVSLIDVIQQWGATSGGMTLAQLLAWLRIGSLPVDRTRWLH